MFLFILTDYDLQGIQQDPKYLDELTTINYRLLLANPLKYYDTVPESGVRFVRSSLV